MWNYGFSLMMAPLVCLFAFQLECTGAAISLLIPVEILDSGHGGVGLPAVIISFGYYASYFQSPGQGWALVLAGAGLMMMLTAALTFLFLARSRAFGAMRESEAFSRLLFKSSPRPAWVFDRETLSFLAVNDAAVVRYGYTREEFRRMTIKDIRPPDDVPKLLDQIAHDVEVPPDKVWRHRKKDGSVIYVEITYAELNFRGRQAALVLAHDVTKRVQAEEALRHAEEKYRSIVENAVEGIFQSTPDGRFISVNPAMARMFGFDSPEQMIAERTDIGRQHYVDPSRRTEMRRMLEERGVVLGFVAEAYRRDGGTIWTSSNTRAVSDAEGAVLYYEGFIEDITERVRADELRVGQARGAVKQSRHGALRAEVAAALAESGIPLRALLQRSTEATVEHLDAALARVWTLNSAENVLELQASAGLYTDLHDEYARIPVGHLKAGLIAKDRVPHLSNNVQTDEDIGDSEWARREGLVSYVGYPLIVEDRLVGVIAMFAREPLQQDTLDALASVAVTIAQGIERKRAEGALRRSEEKFRRLIEDLHIGVLLQGPRAEVLLSNPAARELLGLTEDQLASRTSFDPDWDVVHEDGTDFPGETHPPPRAIATRKAVRNVVMGVYRPASRDRVWLLVNADPQFGDDGSVSHVICTFSDITERKRTEEALRQSEERYRAFLKAVPDLMFLQTKEGVYLDYHVKDQSQLLVPPESFLGKNMRDVLPPELAEELASCFERAVRRGGTQVCEYTLLVGGRRRSYEARIVNCDGDKMLSVVRDVTERTRAEAERTDLLRRLVNAQEEERERLAREVHDEFAAYLSALKWGIESLRRAEGLPAQAESGLSYLLGLTTQLQHKVHDFAFDLSPAELDHKDGLPAALDQYVRRWAERVGDQLDAEFRGVGSDARLLRLPREVETAIYRATQEALTNVLKHAGAQRVNVTLGVYAPEPGQGVVRLTVEDDGVGFGPGPSDGAERGLGLKGMGERIALVGGTLEVRSDKSGTTLMVSVPVPITHEGSLR